MHRTRHALAAAIAALGVAPAFAAGARIDIIPVSAAPGQPRTLTVKGTWHNACIPTGATVVAPQPDSARTLSIALTVPPADACGQAETPFEVSVPYTPDRAGHVPVVALAPGYAVVASGAILTARAGMDRSIFNVSGNWYDPATGGSGIAFVHSHEGADQLFGTWYVYDGNGQPRWYVLSNARWVAGGVVAEGDMVQTAAPGGACPGSASSRGCPKAADQLTSVGRFRLFLFGGEEAIVEARALDGSVLWTSTLKRLGL